MAAKSGRTSAAAMRAASAAATSTTKPRALAPEAELGNLFKEHGYLRIPDVQRRREGYENYKKGWEVRLVLGDRRTLATVRKLLRRVRLPVARPFRKGKKWVQPVYGREAVELFRSWIGEG